MTKVGFIGLGIMGLPMAINLKNAGIELMVNDLNHQSVRQMTDSWSFRRNKGADWKGMRHYFYDPSKWYDCEGCCFRERRDCICGQKRDGHM